MITLNRYPLITEVVDGVTFYVLEVRSTSLAGADSAKIFVYHAAMNDDAFEGDKFEAVCSAHQMVEIPSDEACDFDETHVVPYYRSSTLRILMNTPVDAENLWADIKEDVRELADQIAGSDAFYAAID